MIFVFALTEIYVCVGGGFLAEWEGGRAAGRQWRHPAAMLPAV